MVRRQGPIQALYGAFTSKGGDQNQNRDPAEEGSYRRQDRQRPLQALIGVVAAKANESKSKPQYNNSNNASYKPGYQGEQSRRPQYDSSSSDRGYQGGSSSGPPPPRPQYDNAPYNPGSKGEQSYRTEYDNAAYPRDFEGGAPAGPPPPRSQYDERGYRNEKSPSGPQRGNAGIDRGVGSSSSRPRSNSGGQSSYADERGSRGEQQNRGFQQGGADERDSMPPPYEATNSRAPQNNSRPHGMSEIG